MIEEKKVGSDSDAFYKYILEDKSKYKTATESGFIDPDNDFLVGDSGGFLLNYNFKVIDTYKFSEVADHHDEYGYYTDSPEGSLSHRQFVNTESSRRLHGITYNCKLLLEDEAEYYRLPPNKRSKLLKPLRITGDHYNFLNYTEISRVDKASMEIGSSRTATKSDGFPRFFVSQYWLSKVLEFCHANGYNLVTAKSRRAGFSFFQSSRSANRTNLVPNSKWVVSAYDKKYLIRSGGLSDMTRRNLNFYESNTPFNRGPKGDGLLKKDLEELKVGFLDKGGTEQGYLGSIFAVSFGPKQADAAIGKDGWEINIEELTNAPNLNEFLDVTDPATTAGTFKTGIIFGWGTTGSREGSWAKFRDWFFNPDAYNAIGFENVWDKESRNETCGYFKPFWESLEGINTAGVAAMDEHGNSNFKVAMELSDIERVAAKASKDEAAYIVHCGQFANTPSEAFFTSTGSMFSSEALISHATRVKNDPELRYHIDGNVIDTKGTLEFRSNTWLKENGYNTNPFIPSYYRRSKDNVKGCIRLWHKPYIDPSTGRIPNDMYYVVYDPFGKDKLPKDVKVDDSLASIHVYMRPNPFIGPKCDLMVASYSGRLATMEETDRTALNLCLYYGGFDNMFLPEVNRGETIKNFRLWKNLKLMASDPMYAWDANMSDKEGNKYGIVIGDGGTKSRGLQYLYEDLYTVVGRTNTNAPIYAFQYIYDLPYLEELLKYDYTGNFDRVSTGIVKAYFSNSNMFASKKVNKEKANDENSIWNRSWYPE